VSRRATVRPLREMSLEEGSSLGRAAPTPPGPGAAASFGAPGEEIEPTFDPATRLNCVPRQRVRPFNLSRGYSLAVRA
jgi:hypothetical protein